MIMFRYLQFALLGASLAGAFVPSLKADNFDKKTILTVNEPVAVENVVLTPGEYVLKLLDSQSNRQIVEIFNGDETKLIGTELAMPAYRPVRSGKERLTFYEAPSGQLPALRTWFNPGDTNGIEFLPPETASAVKANSD
jgi:hypothetical protein